MATQAVQRIAWLYRIEHEARDLPKEERLAVRQARSTPLWEELHGYPSTVVHDWMTAAQLDSTLTCPHCGQVSVERMPTNACQWFHECAGCRALLSPLAGHCCVFCSYGSVPCPPIQADSAECCGAKSPG